MFFQPDFIKELTPMARTFIRSLGSDYIENLVQYESFLIVCRIGGRVLFEAVRPKYASPTWEMIQNGLHWDGPPMQIEVNIIPDIKGKRYD